MNKSKTGYKGSDSQSPLKTGSQNYKKTVPIRGMHCASCELLIADELESLPGVISAEASLKTKSATMVSTKNIASADIIRAIESAGYEVGFEGKKPLITRSARIWKDFLIGVVVTAVIYLLFQGLGIDKLMASSADGSSSNGVMALIVGLTAGVSTCMALIGGLVLSVASKYAENHPTETPLQKFRPHLFFNLGRIASFIILGAVIGAIGSAFALTGTLLGFLTIAVGIVMLLLGLQLTGLFPRITKGLTLPSGLAKRLGVTTNSEREYSHGRAAMMGAVTFFLPCGFTQAMQLLAVSTGSPVESAIIMGAFAIGTAPGLLGLGGLTSVVKGAFAKRFFRVIGVAVVAMAFLNFSNGFNLAGIQLSLNNILPTAKDSAVTDGASSGGSAILSTTYTLKSDIIPSTFTAKVGQKTTLVVDVKENGQGCMSTILIVGLDDNAQYLRRGRMLELTFTATKPGNYTIACAMGIPRGTIKVTT